MACYNSGEFLEGAIQSIISQTYDRWELIIVDDASTDDSRTIAEKYCALDSRVRLLKFTKNLGVSAARNAGISVADGKFIAILDSDDVAEPQRLELQVNVAVASEMASIVMSDSKSINRNGEPIKSHNYPTDSHKLYRRLLRRRAFPPHSSMLYNRSSLEKVGGFDQRYAPAEDCELWFRLSETGPCLSVSQCLVKIRKHPESISNQDGGRKQIRRGIMAASLHILRTAPRYRTRVTPATNLDEYEDCVDLWLKSSGYYSILTEWASQRGAYLARHKIWGFGTLVLKIAESEDLHRFVNLKFLGSEMPEIIAEKWALRNGYLRQI
jgi:glycosyltransferase involved in cell wall biosynthesis